MSEEAELEKIKRNMKALSAASKEAYPERWRVLFCLDGILEGEDAGVRLYHRQVTASYESSIPGQKCPDEYRCTSCLGVEE